MPATAESQKPRRRWLTAYAPLFVWIITVLSLGSFIGSMKETSKVIRPLLEFLFPSASPETLTVYHVYIRKLAHITEYAVLAFLAVRALRATTISRLRNYRFALAVLIVLAVASVDEFHQSFEATRTSTPWDVVIDMIGGVVAAIVLYFFYRRKNKSK
jgi:VanZ family protein